MAAYLTIDELLLENKTLKERVKQLEKELRVTQIQRAELKDKLDEIKESINDRNNEDVCEILEFFHSCSSIRRTAWKYGMELDELYNSIPQWEDTWRGLEAASDYDECRKEVIGRQEYDADEEREMTAEEIKNRDRTPIKEELDCLISDYKESSLTIYELADRYNLCIYNLFRLLKKNNLIETETDAKGYAGFYTEFMGAGSEWDGKCEIGLL